MFQLCHVSYSTKPFFSILYPTVLFYLSDFSLYCHPESLDVAAWFLQPLNYKRGQSSVGHSRSSEFIFFLFLLNFILLFSNDRAETNHHFGYCLWNMIPFLLQSYLLIPTSSQLITSWLIILALINAFVVSFYFEGSKLTLFWKIWSELWLKMFLKNYLCILLQRYLWMFAC